MQIALYVRKEAVHGRTDTFGIVSLPFQKFLSIFDLSSQ